MSDSKVIQTYIYVEFDVPVLVHDGENPADVAEDEILDALSSWTIPPHNILEIRVGEVIDE